MCGARPCFAPATRVLGSKGQKRAPLLVQSAPRGRNIELIGAQETA